MRMFEQPFLNTLDPRLNSFDAGAASVLCRFKMTFARRPQRSRQMTGRHQSRSGLFDNFGLYSFIPCSQSGGG
jgi:hypothetical protein